MNEFLRTLEHEFHLPLENPVLVFCIILFIILVSPIIFKRINIPGIIVLIISGIVIGPHGLNILAQSSAIELFSTIGIIYIMFIAGLELDMNEFKATRHKSVLFGFFTFSIPMIVGFPVCYYLLGFDFNASILTTAMFATHTLVAYPIVSKLGIAKNQAVAVAVGGTILTDAAVLTILAVIVESSNGNLNSEFWIRLGVSLVIFMFILFFIIPRIAKWFFRKLENERHSHYIFVLAVVFFAAFLSELAGLEPIIGAFVAGLAINPLIPHSSALMNRIEFIGNSLFIPFFLISVGMLVDINVIFSGTSSLIVAGILTLVAIFTKWLAAFFAQVLFRYTKLQRNLIFGLSTSRAAATLAVILVGYEAGIVNETILNGTIILILITCIVSSFVTEQAAKKILISSEDNTDLQLKGSGNNEHILIPIANTINLDKVLEFAILIKNKKSPHPLSILSVVPNNREAEKNIANAKQKLENFVKDATATETLVEAVATIDHNAASGISRTAREIMADIILVGWPQRTGFLDKLIGDKMDSILANTDKTLFICDFVNPLISHKRLFMVVPPRAEIEEGFGIWLTKLAKFSAELTLPVRFSCSNETQNAILKFSKKQKLTLAATFNEFTDWDSFFIFSEEILPTDFIMVVSARKGYISHFHFLDRLPPKLERNFPKHSKIIIYPQ